MKKILVAILLTAVVIVPVSCRQSSSGNPPAGKVTGGHISIESLPKKEDGKSLPEIFEDKTPDTAEIGASRELKTDPDSVSVSCAYLIKDNRFGSGTILHDLFLAVETDTEILYLDMGRESYNDTLFTADIDGDLADEIIVTRTISMEAVTNQYETYIYKVQNGSVNEIQRFTADFNTGYQGELKDGFSVTIKNSFVSFEYTLPLQNTAALISGGAYDAEGKVIGGDVVFDSFFEVLPLIREDGTGFDLRVSQYAWMVEHGNAVGTARSMLRYQDGEFVVIGAEFLEAGVR